MVRLTGSDRWSRWECDKTIEYTAFSAILHFVRVWNSQTEICVWCGGKLEIKQLTLFLDQVSVHYRSEHMANCCCWKQWKWHSLWVMGGLYWAFNTCTM